jgi:hypothetical protein
MNPDSEAMADNAKREIEEMKRKMQPLTEQDEAAGSSLTLEKIKSLYKFVNTGEVHITGNDVVDAHTNKGVCQESYDQGYEDGLKAAKEGDTRIK